MGFLLIFVIYFFCMDLSRRLSLQVFMQYFFSTPLSKPNFALSQPRSGRSQEGEASTRQRGHGPHQGHDHDP